MCTRRGVWGLFLRWWPPSTMWEGPLIFSCPRPGCLNNPIFSNLRLCAACRPHFMCHHELWPTSVSHPFSSLNSSLGLCKRKYYQEITILSLHLFKILLFQVAFLIFFSITIFSLHFLLVGLLLQYVTISVHGTG